MYSLVIDCSHKENFIGLFKNTDRWVIEHKFIGQPFEDLVKNLKNTLVDAGVRHSQITRFYTPHSPGSTLGIRVTQMMIQGLLKTCCPDAQLTEYNGYYLSALLLLEEGVEANKSNYLITENGRHSWKVLKIDNNLKIRPEIQRYELEALSKLEGNIFYIPQVKTWPNPLSNVEELDYSPDQFLKAIKLLDRLSIDTSLLMPTNNTYVKWNQK